MSGYRLFFLVFFATLSIFMCTDAAITPEVATYNVSVGQDFTLPWEYDNETKMFTVDWSYKSSSATLATNIMSQDQGASANPLKDNVQHIGNGNIKLLSVKKEDEGIYYCAVTYDVILSLPSVTGTATLSVIEHDVPVPSLGIALIVIGCLYLCGIVIAIFMYCYRNEPCNKIYVGDKIPFWVWPLIIIIVGLGILTVYGICKCCDSFGCCGSNNEQQGDENKNKTTRPQPAPPRNSLEARPMPAIPRNKVQENNYGHDGKGHGVSVNDHPMTIMNIPEKKAGILDPVHEKSEEQEQKKKKKKKKKKETPRETNEEYGADN